MKCLLAIRALTTVGLAALMANSAQSQVYTVTDLGQIAGSTAALPDAINASGQISGTTVAVGTGYNYHAFLYNGTMTDLGTVGRSSSEGYALNNTGKVVGYANGLPALFSGGKVTTLSKKSGSANGINNNTSPKVVGRANNAAFVWQGGTLTTLAGLVGASGSAQCINDAGVIAGYSPNSEGRNQACIFSTSGSAAPLAGLGGLYSFALAINSAGQIAGEAYTSAGERHAALWTGGSPTDLGVLAGRTQSGAWALNLSGVVVGVSYSSSAPERGFIWDATNGIRELTSLLDPVTGAGWTIMRATGINDDGKICAFASYNGGAWRGVLLTP